MEMPLSFRLKIFLWDLFVRPISNILKMKIKISNLLLSLWILSTTAFVLNHFKLLPKELIRFSNIFFNLGLLLLYLIMVLVDRWRSGDDIARWRKIKGIPNPQEIHRIVKNYQQESSKKTTEKFINSKLLNK